MHLYPGAIKKTNMKYFITILCILMQWPVWAQPRFELSTNVYRVPYDNGYPMIVSRDHFTHTNPNFDVTGRYDLVGEGLGSGCSVYRIVAAAPGIIRRIVDNHDTRPPDCDPNCDNFNNYVWIEHANDEWSKYTHMKKNSSTTDAGLAVGDTVCAGRFLGYECDVGQASGRHLHFEVRRPNNPATINISVAGGFMARNDAAHLVPVINSITKHYFEDGDTWVGSLSTSCTNTTVTVPAITIGTDGFRIYMASNTIVTNNNAVVFQNTSNGMFHAENSVTLSPGFTASAGSYFHARIGNCATTNIPGGCQ